MSGYPQLRGVEAQPIAERRDGRMAALNLTADPQQTLYCMDVLRSTGARLPVSLTLAHPGVDSGETRVSGAAEAADQVSSWAAVFAFRIPRPARRPRSRRASN